MQFTGSLKHLRNKTISPIKNMKIGIPGIDLRESNS